VSTPFSYLPNEIDALEAGLSIERFRPYVQLAKGDRLAAIHLYEKNARLAGALYSSLQGLEICLRNAIQRALTRGYGVEWFDRLPALEYPLPEKLAAAKSSVLAAGKQLTPGRIVAELSFGFWTALLAGRYEKRLWVPHLHRAFPHAFVQSESRRTTAGARPKLSRRTIAYRLDRIRYLRNRIAHHEPIIRRSFYADFTDIVEATAWICPTTAAWLALTSAFPPQDSERVPPTDVRGGSGG
jgi:hypothetical protein